MQLAGHPVTRNGCHRDQPGQFDIGFELARIAGAWYVTGINLDF